MYKIKNQSKSVSNAGTFGGENGDAELVLSVDYLDLVLLKAKPPALGLRAFGTASTPGWRDPHLSPYVYVKPPADNIQEYDFLAIPPSGLVPQVLVPIVSAYDVLALPPWAVGVRIKAKTNHVERRLVSSEADFPIDLAFEDDESLEQLQPSGGKMVDDGDRVELLAESVSILRAASEQCKSIDLLKLSDWPEVKTDWVMKCVKLLGKKVCTKVPKLYRRSCTLVISAEVCWPTGQSIWGDIADCIKQGVAAGVLVGIITGNLAAASAALESYVKACLALKLGNAAGNVRLGLKRKTICGPWKPV